MEPVEKTELHILSEISRISNAAISLAEKLQRITEAVARGMGKDGASLFLIDGSETSVTLSAAVGLNQGSVGRLSFPFGKGVAGWVAEQKVPLALEEPFTDPRFALVPESGIEKFKSLAAAPILDGDRCLGVLFVLSTKSWRAASSDITLLTTTANQISGVIRSAQLFENIQQRLAELATIYEIGMALTATLDLGQLLTLIAKHTTHALRAEGCAIRLRNAHEGPAPGAAGSHGLFKGTAGDMDSADSNGFGDDLSWRGSPWGWAEVLAQHGSLRLDFGHFGHMKGVPSTGEIKEKELLDCLVWAKHIAGLMEKHEGVYADLSNSPLGLADPPADPTKDCPADKEETATHDRCYRTRFQPFLEGLLEAHPVVAKRIMYGSDWWLNALGDGRASFRRRLTEIMPKMKGVGGRDFFEKKAHEFIGDA